MDSEAENEKLFSRIIVEHFGADAVIVEESLEQGYYTDGDIVVCLIRPGDGMIDFLDGLEGTND
jgi:hypothetical protein